MTFYHNNTWIAFLSEHIVQQSVKISIDDCPGCQDRLQSSILHLHEQQSLLDKIRNNFVQVRGIILLNIDSFYSKIESKLPHSNDRKKDKIVYCNLARSFLLTATPDSLYFGGIFQQKTIALLQRLFVKQRKDLPRI